MVDSMHCVNCETNVDEIKALPLNSYFRKDEVCSLNTRNDLFDNLPPKEQEFAKKSGYYRVPRIVDN